MSVDGCKCRAADILNSQSDGDEHGDVDDSIDYGYDVVDDDVVAAVVATVAQPPAGQFPIPTDRVLCPLIVEKAENATGLATNSTL